MWRPSSRSCYRGKRGRQKDLVTRILNDWTVTFAFGARGNPLRIVHKLGPLLLPFGERLPGQQISQFVIGFADQGGPEAGLANSIFFQRCSVTFSKRCSKAGSLPGTQR